MPSDPIIRPGTIDDMPVACEIAVLAWQPIFVEFRRRLGDDLFLQLYHDWENSKRAQVRGAFEHDPPRVLVTEIDGQVVGFCTYYLPDAAHGLGEIGNNAVHPGFQGRGLARRQYERVFEELRAEGMTAIRVTTGLDEAHAPARRAYEAVGFEKFLPQLAYYRKL